MRRLQFALTGDRKLLEETERRVQRLLSHQEAAEAAVKNRELWEASCPTHFETASLGLDPRCILYL